MLNDSASSEFYTWVGGELGAERDGISEVGGELDAEREASGEWGAWGGGERGSSCGSGYGTVGAA